MPKDLIRQIDAAEYLGVTRQYIGKLVKLNKIKTYTVAKLVSKKELEPFLKIEKEIG